MHNLLSMILKKQKGLLPELYTDSSSLSELRREWSSDPEVELLDSESLSISV
jgi:hypothetical protein